MIMKKTALALLLALVIPLSALADKTAEEVFKEFEKITPTEYRNKYSSSE